MISNIDRIREVFCGSTPPAGPINMLNLVSLDEPAASCNRRNGVLG